MIKERKTRVTWKAGFLVGKRGADARYYESTKATRAEYAAAYYRRNRERQLASTKDWYDCNKERVKKYKKEWQARKQASDPAFRLKRALRKRIWDAIRCHYKSARTMELTGCSMEFLLGWLESRFLPGMSWENYGKNGWHVDHIIPCDFFDFSDPEQQRQCFHYSNLQPLWEKDNLSKGHRTNFAGGPVRNWNKTSEDEVNARRPQNRHSKEPQKPKTQ